VVAVVPLVQQRASQCGTPSAFSTAGLDQAAGLCGVAVAVKAAAGLCGVAVAVAVAK
jgi:hypothetical protein